MKYAGQATILYETNYFSLTTLINVLDQNGGISVCFVHNLFYRRSMFRNIFSSKLSFIALIFAFFIFANNSFGGFIYVSTDDANGNFIYGYSVNETTGELTLLPGFPVATGFTGAALTNLEHLAIDKLNKRLYVVNRASNNISAYSINEATGEIALLPFSPIISVANQRTIKVHPSGSPVMVGADSFASFVVTPTSATPAEGSPYALPAGVSPAVSTLSPDGQYYYAGGNSGNFISGFSVNAATGVLTTLPGAPFDTGSSNPVPFAIDASGRLYLSSSRQALMRLFTLPDGVPTAVTGSPFSIAETGFASVGALHPSGNFFALPNRTRNHVYMVNVSGSGAATTLSAIKGSPFLTGGTTSHNSLFNSDGSFLFVANGGSRNLTRFNVNGVTGSLSDQFILPANSFGETGSISGMGYVHFDTKATPVRVAGRIRYANGNAAVKASVSLTDGSGNVRTVLSNGFGYFTFPDVMTGSTYTLSATTRSTPFQSQTIVLQGELLNLEIVESGNTFTRQR